jgi:hypothetical protein
MPVTAIKQQGSDRNTLAGRAQPHTAQTCHQILSVTIANTKITNVTITLLGTHACWRCRRI